MNKKITQITAMAQAMIDQVAEMGRQNRNGDELITADSAEREIFEQTLRFGHALFDLFLAENGDGNVGMETDSGLIAHLRNKQVTSKTYQSIFGLHTYQHWKYYPGDEPGPYFSPFEARLNIQERRSSYLVQDMLSNLAVNVPMAEAASIFHSFFNQSVSKRSVDDIIVDQSAHLTAYEQQPKPEFSESEGDIVVATFDGKGVSMLKGSRLSSDGTKRMSMIGADYTVDRYIRNPAEVATNLVYSQFPEICLLEEKEAAEKKVIPCAVNKHYQVGIEKKETVFEQIRLSVDRRHQPGQDLVVLVDGALDLRTQVEKHFSDATVMILDVIHAVGYIGKSTKALYNADDYRAQLHIYVDLLLSQGEEGARMIVEDLKKKLKEAIKISEVDSKQVNSTITYFTNNYDRMRYDQYLAAGYPIATGVIESACGMLVCDRMDFAGARWHLSGAEAVLKMRAIKKSNEWKNYQKFRKEREYDRLYAKTG